jgi:hypothetical protein
MFGWGQKLPWRPQSPTSGSIADSSRTSPFSPLFLGSFPAAILVARKRALESSCSELTCPILGQSGPCPREGNAAAVDMAVRDRSDIGPRCSCETAANLPPRHLGEIKLSLPMPARTICDPVPSTGDGNSGQRIRGALINLPLALWARFHRCVRFYCAFFPRYSFVLIADRTANAAGLRERRRYVCECQMR